MNDLVLKSPFLSSLRKGCSNIEFNMSKISNNSYPKVTFYNLMNQSDS